MTGFDELLPVECVSLETHLGDPSVGVYAGEELLVEGVVEARRREIIESRDLARRALGRLGVVPVAIPRGERGQPLWPAGIVGSITHQGSFRAVAAARCGGGIISLGIDAEPAEELPSGVDNTVATPNERAMLQGLLRRTSAVPWGRVLFSAKESVYKAWFPLYGTWLDYEQVEILFGDVGEFMARHRHPLADGLEWPGRYAISDGLIRTAVAVEATLCSG